MRGQSIGTHCALARFVSYLPTDRRTMTNPSNLTPPLPTTDQRIYVACLASYNAGTLHGRWIDASDDVDEMEEQIQAMLRDSPNPNTLVDCPTCEGDGCEDCRAGKVPSAEEYAIHDHEGFPWGIGEYESLETIADYMEKREAACDGDAFDAAVNYHGGDLDQATRMAEGYCGAWERGGDYAEEHWEGVGIEISEGIRPYIDWEAMERDMVISGDLIEVEHGGQRHLFHGHY